MCLVLLLYPVSILIGFCQSVSLGQSWVSMRLKFVTAVVIFLVMQEIEWTVILSIQASLSDAGVYGTSICGPGTV